MTLKLDLQKVCEAKVPEAANLELWIKTALNAAQHIENSSLTIRFVEIDESQQLNSSYRQKNQPTNVLSFPFEKPIGVEDQEVNTYLGDLVICSEVVINEAVEQQKPIESHWAHMCVHGCLHLLGFDHITTEDAETMEQLEIDILNSLDISNPYIDTATD